MAAKKRINSFDSISRLALTDEQMSKVDEMFIEHNEKMIDEVDETKFVFLAHKNNGVYDVTYNQVYGRSINRLSANRTSRWNQPSNATERYPVMFGALSDYLIENDLDKTSDSSATNSTDFRIPVIICTECSHPARNNGFDSAVGMYAREVADRGSAVATALSMFSDMVSEFAIVTNMRIDDMMKRLKRECNAMLGDNLENALVYVAACGQNNKIIVNSPFCLDAPPARKYKDFIVAYTGSIDELQKSTKKAANCYSTNVRNECIESALSSMFTFNDKTRKQIPEAIKLLTFGNESVEETKRDRRVSKDMLSFIEYTVDKPSIGIDSSKYDVLKNRLLAVRDIWDTSFSVCNIKIKKAPYNNEIMQRLSSCAEALETKYMVDALYKGVPYSDLIAMRTY